MHSFSDMQTLFPIPPGLPQGFHYYPDFISEEEEQELLKMIQSYPLKNMIFHGFEAKRKVLSFGYDYRFDSRKLSETLPIPGEFRPLIRNVGGRLGIAENGFVKMLLTEYNTGTVINWHRDAPPFGKIAGISLLSDCRYKLRPYNKALQTRAAVRAFTVERRSLYLMEGAARDEWEHSISPIKSLRYSITIRTLRDA